LYERFTRISQTKYLLQNNCASHYRFTDVRDNLPPFGSWGDICAQPSGPSRPDSSLFQQMMERMIASRTNIERVDITLTEANVHAFHFQITIPPVDSVHRLPHRLRLPEPFRLLQQAKIISDLPSRRTFRESLDENHRPFLQRKSPPSIVVMLLPAVDVSTLLLLPV